MSAQYQFHSVIAPVILRYVALKRSLGRSFESGAYALARLDRFLVSQQASDLTATTFSSWGLSMAHLTPSGRRNRVRTVYQLCLYRRRTEPGCFVPDPTQFPSAQQRIRPHIFSENEITRILRAAQELGREKKALEGTVVSLQNIAQGLTDTDDLFELARSEDDEDTVVAVEAVDGIIQHVDLEEKVLPPRASAAVPC